MNFSAEITGQFGIGVLSYFMLADRFEIRTLRRRDKDGCAWQFVSDGLESFGELKSISFDALDEHGTELSLRLRPDILGEGVEHWTDRLSTYLGEKLIFAPCNTHLTLGVETKLDARAGWVRDEEYYKQFVLAPLDDMIAQTNAEGLITAEREAELYFEREALEEARATIEDALTFSIKEGFLSEGRGRWRALLPVFTQPDGNKSLAYPIEVSRVIAGRRLRIIAWKGIAAEHHSSDGSSFDADSDAAPVIVELDFQSGDNATLSVNRDNLTLTGKWLNLVDRALAGSAQLLDDHLSENAETPWSLMDCCLARGTDEHHRLPLDGRFWPARTPGASNTTFTTPTFPAARSRTVGPFTWRGTPVTRIRDLVVVVTSGHSYTKFTFPFKPHQIVLVRDQRREKLRICHLWTKMPDGNAPQGLGTLFPPEWTDILAVQSEAGTSLNKNHPLVQQVPPSAWDWAQSLDHIFDVEPLRSGLTDPTHAAAWLLSALVEFEFDTLEALTERQSAIVTDIWNNTVGAQDLHLINARYGVELSTSIELVVVPAPPFHDWKQHLQRELPKGEEWYLQPIEADDGGAKS